MRQYNLYVQHKRAYEVVPIGYAWSVLFLGPFLAFSHGLFLRYLVVVGLSAIPLIAFEALDLGFDFTVLGIAAINACHIYIGAKFWAWREHSLAGDGFKFVASIAASSAPKALESWAKSDAAQEFLSGAA